jgi:hypothetical protein
VDDDRGRIAVLPVAETVIPIVASLQGPGIKGPESHCHGPQRPRDSGGARPRLSTAWTQSYAPISLSLKRGLGTEPSNELFKLIQIKAIRCDLCILVHRHAKTNWPYTMKNRSSEWEPGGKPDCQPNMMGEPAALPRRLLS